MGHHLKSPGSRALRPVVLMWARVPGGLPVPGGPFWGARSRGKKIAGPQPPDPRVARPEGQKSVVTVSNPAPGGGLGAGSVGGPSAGIKKGVLCERGNVGGSLSRLGKKAGPPSGEPGRGKTTRKTEKGPP